MVEYEYSQKLNLSLKKLDRNQQYGKVSQISFLRFPVLPGSESRTALRNRAGCTGHRSTCRNVCNSKHVDGSGSAACTPVTKHPPAHVYTMYTMYFGAALQGSEHKLYNEDGKR